MKWEGSEEMRSFENRFVRNEAGGASAVGMIIVLLLGILIGGGAYFAITYQRGSGNADIVAADQPVTDSNLDSSSDELLSVSRQQASSELSGEAIGNSRRTAIVTAAEQVGPAVVSIWVTQVRRTSPFGSGNMNSFFDMFMNRQPRTEEVPSIGSGVIIDPRGIVVTNHHVLENANSIVVTLPDGRSFDGTVIGSDPLYDLGVIRIEGENLPSAKVGDSSDLMVGEWAICVGNPFGFLLNDYKPTVTAGVISATNRDIKMQEQRGHGGSQSQPIYKEMIQTDASINPGNSGGALVNSLGDVVGINTFIFSTTGGSLGIGFAIPINTVVRVVREILEYGEVREYWIGIKAQDITRGLANYFGIRDPLGVLVWGLDEGSPAAKAGVLVGDIIRQINGESVSSAKAAQRHIFGAGIGDTIVLTIERDNKITDYEILLEERPTQ
jgi:serine protease Do